MQVGKVSLITRTALVQFIGMVVVGFICLELVMCCSTLGVPAGVGLLEGVKVSWKSALIGVVGLSGLVFLVSQFIHLGGSLLSLLCVRGVAEFDARVFGVGTDRLSGGKHDGLASPSNDLDITASTDGEDLFVFVADVLEFGQQDVLLLWDTCGEGFLVLGLVAGIGGLGVWFSRKVLAGRRLK